MRLRFGAVVCCVVLSLAAPAASAQDEAAKQEKLIDVKRLPLDFAATLRKMGGRFSSADKAAVSLAGTLVDSEGKRAAQLTVQAPGLLRFQDGGSRVLAYDGSQWNSASAKGGQDDTRIQESLLAHSPDAVLMQMAAGGSARRIGSRFRTDNGKTPNYSGPYLTMYEFSPEPRKGLANGQAFQQTLLIGIDEATWLISEIRVISGAARGEQQVTQTKFSKWFQHDGQWFPGEITRLEGGKQVLAFTADRAAIGSEVATAAFKP